MIDVLTSTIIIQQVELVIFFSKYVFGDKKNDVSVI